MTKGKRGRPSGSALYTIQKHVFLDKQTAAQLERLARASGLTESAYMRQLIQMAANPHKNAPWGYSDDF